MLRKLSPLYSPVYERFVRDHLPRKHAVLNGVVTPAARLFDPDDHWPNHKQRNVKAIRNAIEATDLVVEVGSGYGVCTVWSAREASEGRVVSYEAGNKMVDVARKAVTRTGEVIDEDLESRVEVHHGIVGTNVDVWGSTAGAKVVHPTELAECDVLITDCEGAELSIIENMSIRPREAIVETHPTMGVETAAVRDEFEEMGYNVSIHGNRESDEVQVLVASKAAE